MMGIYGTCCALAGVLLAPYLNGPMGIGLGVVCLIVGYIIEDVFC